MSDFQTLPIPALGIPAYRALYGMFIDAVVQVSDEMKATIISGMKGATFVRFMLALVEPDGVLRIDVFYEAERPWLRVRLLLGGEWHNGLEVRHDAIGIDAAVIDLDQRIRMEEAIADITEGVL